MIPLHDDNPTSIKPIVTGSIVAACIIVFLWELSLSGDEQGLIIAFSLVPSQLLGGGSLGADVLMIVPPWATLLTSMFLHGGWLHLIGNMLYLWIFGNNVEDSMGHGRFLIFYIVCGLAAGLAHAIPNASSSVPTLGASGAVSGVLGAYLILYPRARVLVLVPLGFVYRIIKLPALIVLGFWFILQIIYSVVGGLSGGGVAWGAHIGGFVAGMVLIPVFKHRSFHLFSNGYG